MIHHRADRTNREALSLRLTHVENKDGEPVGLLRNLVARRSARQQQHEVRVFSARRPNLLSIDNITVAAPLGEGLDRACISAAGRLCHPERLQAKLSRRNLWKVALLLLVTAVPEERAHDVHLSVTGGAIAAAVLDFLKNGCAGRQRKACTPIFLGNQGRQVASFRQRSDKLTWIPALSILSSPIFSRESFAKLSH